MPKILTGKVVSTKMQGTVVVKVTTLRPHPIYKRRIRQDKRIKAATFGLAVREGETVRIIQTQPVSREKHFKVLEVIKK